MSHLADLRITSLDSWPLLVRDPGYEVVVDPVVYRIGDLFLADGPARRAGGAADQSWTQIGEDIGGLVTFFDLLVLHERVPAFDYSVTFDPLSDKINRAGGDTIIHDVRVDAAVYEPIRNAVVAHLHDRIAKGPFVPAAVARQIPRYLADLGYQWAPDISHLEADLPDEVSRTVAQFLVGHLLFAGYAQLSGLPHVLSPRRGRLMAAAGLPVDQGAPSAEGALWSRVGERLAGQPGWRDEVLPWTPSFLPYLLQQTNARGGGTATLLKLALDLRHKNSVESYRELRRRALGADDSQETVEARRALANEATKVAKDLGTRREDLAYTHSFIVGAGPKALGFAGGAGFGLLIGGPPGAFVGGLVGAVAPDVLEPATERLWGWVIDRLPFVSSRKLLSRAAGAEVEVGTGLIDSAREIWRRGSF